MTNKKLSKKKAPGKGIDVVSVPSDWMEKLRANKAQNGISIVHFVKAALQEKWDRDQPQIK